MAQVTVTLPSGTEIEVQSSHVTTPRGEREAGALDRLAAQDWGKLMDRVVEMSNAAIGKLKGAIPECKELAVEFGVSVGGKTGVVLVEGTVTANLKVTVKL
jgi:hypothetical protein